MMILDTTAWIYISEALGLISIFAAMPTLIVLICLTTTRKKFEKRIEFVKTAMEKDPSLNMEDLMAKISPAKRTYAQKSVTLLLISCILLFLGVASALFALYFSSKAAEEPFILFGIIACVLLAVGLSFLVSFFYTRKLVRKELLK